MLKTNWLLCGLPAALIMLIGCQTESPSSVAIDDDDIGGVVTSTNGPEAGVWVIAETNDLGTMFVRIVATDDQGRYLVPDLPTANYKVWVRGYGLADSDKVDAKPGAHVDLTAVIAPDAATAAKVYPAAYWYAMMDLPDDAELEKVRGGRNAYLMWMKNMGCVGCHQMGQRSTRTLPEGIGEFASSEEAWVRRISSGQAGGQMARQAAQLLGGLPTKYLADWTDRIAAGEHPSAIPERPTGIERNVVATVRDWSNEKAYMHDLSGTDRRDPTVNGYGPLYGAPELSTDEIPILDPVANTSTVFHAPVRDEDTPTTNSAPVVAPSPYWGDEAIWDSKANIHNPMLDQVGRVWLTARVRGPETPAFCREGSDHPSARLYPTERNSRQLAMLDPEDGSVWGSNSFAFPGSITRYDPETGLAETYNPPLPGFGVRGADIDTNGVVWTSLGSGHLGEFDRTKCKGPLNGPEATGDHCPEGWTLHDLPGPAFAEEPGLSVESSYYTWVDQHDSLGLGENVPIATGNLFDGVHALVNGAFVTLRVPYPLGFYTKGLEGRIDDPDAGWKGRGIWVPEGDRTPWLKETGKGSKPIVVHFQVRPDPLAK